MRVMRSPLPRREFLRLFGQFGVVCACGGMAVRLAAEQTQAGEPAPKKKLPELKTLAYCGLICDDRCPLYKATRTNDAAAKQKVYEEWKWKEKFGIEFNPDQVFCHGCKAPGKPENIPHSRCTVLKCSAARGFDSCVQCQKLADCDKELWKNYPDFHQQMVKLQQAYAATEGFTLS
jgi:hypothetical protein